MPSVPFTALISIAQNSLHTCNSVEQKKQLQLHILQLPIWMTLAHALSTGLCLIDLGANLELGQVSRLLLRHRPYEESKNPVTHAVEDCHPLVQDTVFVKDYLVVSCTPLCISIRIRILYLRQPPLFTSLQ